MSFIPDFISIDNSHLTLLKKLHTKQSLESIRTSQRIPLPKKELCYCFAHEGKEKPEERKTTSYKNLFTNTKLLEANVFSQALLYHICI